MSPVVSRCLVALLAVATFPALCNAASAADKKQPVSSAAVKAPEPSGAELVGRLLAEQNGPSDPDVPLPKHNLSLNDQPASTPLSGPQIYGRREDGGGVLGLKFPIGVHTGSN